MADVSKIEWTDATWNPITGCTLVSDGCRNCYAAELAAGRLKNHPSRKGLAVRNAEGVAKFTGEVRLNEQWLGQPLRWTKPRMVFVCAHGDLFHEKVPDAWLDRVFAVMALAPQHTFQVLTKRPERMREYFAGNPLYRIGDLARATDTIRASDTITEDGEEGSPVLYAPRIWPLPSVWLGVSVEDQTTADARIPALLDTPAAVRFLSCEPLLGPVDLFDILAPAEWGENDEGWRFNALETGDYYQRTIDVGRDGALISEPSDGPYRDYALDWIIVGGESGRRARPLHPDWARSLRDQCAAAGVPFFFKQWGAWSPIPLWRASQKAPRQTAIAYDGSTVDHCINPDDIGGQRFAFVGKDAAGRTLDGVIHSGFPAGRDAP